MNDEIIINKIEWQAPEYNHKERSNDWYWAIGLIALVGMGIAIWYHNYLFSVFILIAGACLIFFSWRPPETINFVIETKGLSMGRDFFDWKRIKGFDIKKREPHSKLLVETNKHFMPVYSVIIPEEIIPQVKEELLKIVPSKEIEESKSVLLMERIGF